MRKMQQKVIERAVKSGLSDRKIKYPKREDKPVRAYTDLFYFINNYSDEELGDFSIVDILYNLFSKQGKSVYFMLYPEQPSMEKIMEILNDHDTDDTEKVELLNTASKCSLSLTHMKELHRLYSDTLEYGNLYWNLIRTEGIEDKWGLFLEYAGIRDVSKDFLKYALEHDIHQKEAEKYEYRLYNLPEFQYENRFPWLASSFSLPEKGYREMEKKIIPEENTVLNAMKMVKEQLGFHTDITMDIPSETVKIKYTNLTLNMHLYHYRSLLYKQKDTEKDTCYILSISKDAEAHFVCFPNGQWYYQSEKDSRLKPMTIRHLNMIIKKIPYFAESIRNELINTMDTRKEYAMKDLLCIMYEKQCGTAIPSISINEIKGHEDLNSCLGRYYVDGQMYNWNKRNISTGYLFMKALKKIDRSDTGILTNFVYQHHDDKDVINCYNEAAFLEIVLQDRIGIYTDLSEDGDYEYLEARHADIIAVSDYVKMSIALHRKISLRFKSMKKIKEAHNDLAIIYAKKKVGKIEIPKNSKFNVLEKKLPENFKRIKSSKAIKLEGDWMHHCVATYWQKVNQDKCAIFHLIYKEKEYTIEFTISNGQYIIRQIQSRCDRGCPEDVRNYVKECIRDISVG